MKPFRITWGLAALGVVAACAGPADAAWNNVFQVTCNCRSSQRSSGFIAAPSYSVPVVAQASPCCTPPPQVCTTRYVQRCYYQPVTTYQTRSYYEQVTTQQTRYYYEPVTSYRYSAYYDPCSCSYQQVATPVTSYQLRAQSCPVQTWVQRCASVPVTTYQQHSYWEPQTSCTQGCAPAVQAVPVAPSVPPAQPAPSGMALPPPPPGVGEQRQVPPPPGVQEQRSTPPPPLINEKSGPGGQPPNYDPTRQMPPGSPSSQPTGPAPVPGVKLERIVLDDAQRLEGQIVRQDNTPQAHAAVLFVSAKHEAPNQSVTANAQGQFQVTLAGGGWLVYVPGVDGRPVFHSRIDVGDRQPARLTLTAR